MKRKIGVLALQGAFMLHRKMFESLGAGTSEIRGPSDLEGLDAFVIPGGESTTISKMMVRWNLLEPLKELVSDGLPVFGTCAGLILLADRLEGWDDLPRPGGLDVTVRRNAYGRQIDSFETELNIDLPELNGHPFTAVFIRAPRIIAGSTGKNVEVLAVLDGDPVLVREKNILGASFHPEISGDPAVHKWFLENLVR